MRVTRRLGGAIRLRLDAQEVAGLGALIDELIELIDSVGGGDGSPQDQALSDQSIDDDPALRRLFPAAYQDPEEAAEFRRLTASSLLDERVARARRCRDQLGASGRIVLDLDREAATGWLQVLNDLRLALGTRLGITEDDGPGLDPSDAADAELRTVYYWLSWVQDDLVGALMA